MHEDEQRGVGVLVVLGQALVRKGMNAACTAIHIVSHFEPMLEVLI